MASSAERQAAYRERQRAGGHSHVYLYLNHVQKRGLTTALKLLAEDMTKHPELYAHLDQHLEDLRALVDMWPKKPNLGAKDKTASPYTDIRLST